MYVVTVFKICKIAVHVVNDFLGGIVEHVGNIYRPRRKFKVLKKMGEMRVILLWESKFSSAFQLRIR